MSDQGEPMRPASEERGGGDHAGRGGDGARDERGGAEAAQGEHGLARTDPAGSGDLGEPVGPGTRRTHARRLPARARLAVSILGPALLTTAYFTIPFGAIGPHHEVLAWVIPAGLLALLAVGMVITTGHAMTGYSGRYRHPGVGILLLSWAAILVFSASYWAMSTRPGQFVGLQTRLDALYFTGITMSTVGYGDIHPSGQVARAVVLGQLVYTFVFLVSGIAVLRMRARDRMVRRMGG